MPWLALAAELRGQALAVGLALWFERGCAKREEIIVSHGLLSQLNVSPKAGSRALRALEAAGLVSVQRHAGRCPRVTLLKGEQ